MNEVSGMTVGEVISSLRDISVIVGIAVFGWKARSWFQPVIEFFSELKQFIVRANQHMTLVEQGMAVLLENHMAHIQKSVEEIQSRFKVENASEIEEATNRDGNSGARSGEVKSGE
jgi:hypothetical protein